VKLNTRENQFAHQKPVEHWENTKLKCSKISIFQNRKIKMQLK